jgi:hypothetical protein
MTDLPRRSAPRSADPARRSDDWQLLRDVLAGLTADDNPLETCRGELLVHADGRVECLADARCSTDPALHIGVVRCAVDLEGGCCEARETA